MLIGWGGNNGSTLTGAVLANKLGMSWHTKEGLRTANWYGSITQASTVHLGTGPGRDVYLPFKDLMPMVNPNDVVFDGESLFNVYILQGYHVLVSLNPSLKTLCLYPLRTSCL